MISIDQIRAIALSLPETTEEPHFEKTSFRIKKKIYATFDQKTNRVVLKLSQVDQDVFSSAPGRAIYPLPNKWGKQGWTQVEMSKVNRALFTDALTTAYCEVAPKKLAAQVRQIKAE